MAEAELGPDDTVVWEPQPRQSAFITCPADDVGFGGARGGGKSDAVIGDFIDHEETYGQDAIAMAFRRERTQLTELIERSRAVLLPLGYKWHEQDKYFRGPKGGRLRFSYLERDADADAYQGHSYTRIYPEEMGTFPSETPINKLQATLRSGNGVPCQMKGTCNPGGPGHQWVKSRYRLDTHPQGFEVFEFEFTNPFTKRKIVKRRVFIPSRVSDNRFLGDDYVANLYQVGNDNLVRAWLEGDWSVIEGAFFPEWSSAKHVVQPFEIPPTWLRFRAMDWGSARPFVVQWWAVAGDVETEGSEPAVRSGAVQSVEDWQKLYAQTDGAPRSDGSGIKSSVLQYPRGSLICYREWYGGSGPNVGLKMPAEDVGAEIVRRETVNGKREQITYGVLDPAAFASDGGPSIAERLARSGAYFRPADNRRVGVRGTMGGWDQLRSRLRGDGERPSLYVFSTCKDLIRTLPALQHDPDRPEDVDSESDDHAPDTARYACMSRPFVRVIETKPKPPMLGVGPHNEVTLNELWEADERVSAKRTRI